MNMTDHARGQSVTGRPQRLPMQKISWQLRHLLHPQSFKSDAPLIDEWAIHSDCQPISQNWQMALTDSTLTGNPTKQTGTHILSPFW